MKELTLTIEPRDHQSLLREPVVVEIALRNTSNTAVVVNNRLLLNSAASPETSREIVIWIDGPIGYINLTRFNIRSGAPQKEFFIKLKPNEEVRKSYEITNFNSMHQTGKYSIYAVYNNVYDVKIDGKRAWVGMLKSDNVTIERIEETVH